MGNSASIPQQTQQQTPPPGCPMHQKDGEQGQTPKSTPTPTPPEGCPMHNKDTTPIDPRNNMATDLDKSTPDEQSVNLSRTRSVSSIPKTPSADSSKGQCPVNHGEGSANQQQSDKNNEKVENWEYPSPQQFYNALVRKNKAAPQENIDMMVLIHNFLNERAWDEIITWEDRWTQGTEKPQLSRFEGKPSSLSPKARYHLFLAKFFPNTYNSEPPFDRHDWTIFRPNAGTNHRYVIDYYSAPDDEEGNPVFSLDVRPALDSPGAVYERISEWARVKKATYWDKNQNSSS